MFTFLKKPPFVTFRPENFRPGSGYRCSALQNPLDEAQKPSVEGSFLEALRRAATSTLEILGVMRAARTDRGGMEMVAEKWEKYGT